MNKLSRQFSILMSKLITKILSLVFGAGAVILPNASSRLLWRLFCTPPKNRTRNSHLKKKLRGEAKIIDMDYDHSYIRTYGWLHRSETYRGKVVLLHGWGGHALDMASFINPLRDSGYDVIAFDSRAHGESPGRQSTLPEYVNILDTVVSRLGPVYALLSHSFGGMVATNWISENKRPGQSEPVKKLVLVSSPKGMKEVVKYFSTVLDLPSLHHAYLIKKVESVTKQPIEALAVAKFLNKRGVKTMLVHDETDTWVPISDARKIIEAIDNEELLITSGLGHRQILFNDAVIQRTVSFLSD